MSQRRRVQEHPTSCDHGQTMTAIKEFGWTTDSNSGIHRRDNHCPVCGQEIVRIGENGVDLIDEVWGVPYLEYYHTRPDDAGETEVCREYSDGWKESVKVPEQGDEYVIERA